MARFTREDPLSWSSGFLRRLPGPHDGEQVTELGVRLGGIGESLRDFRSQQGPVALPQAADQRSQGCLRHPQLLRQVAVRGPRLEPGELVAQSLELRFLVSCSKFMAQARSEEHPSEL